MSSAFFSASSSEGSKASLHIKRISRCKRIARKCQQGPANRAAVVLGSGGGVGNRSAEGAPHLHSPAEGSSWRDRPWSNPRLLTAEPTTWAPVFLLDWTQHACPQNVQATAPGDRCSLLEPRPALHVEILLNAVRCTGIVPSRRGTAGFTGACVTGPRF